MIGYLDPLAWLTSQGVAFWGGAEEFDWWRVFTWRDYNTRVVVLGTMLLGLAAGLTGSFTLLRRRALMGDALAHATLPGICGAYMLGILLGGTGKSLLYLLLGAGLSGICGILAVLYIKSVTRLKEDVAMGIVLSVFFGGGVALLGLIQQMGGHSAGLETFIYGKTASMVASDAWLIAASAALCFIMSLLLFKELQLLCFDAEFANSRGYPIIVLDTLLMTLVVTITIVGLQAVGLVLMIALLVIPAAAARFWTDQLRWLAIASSLLGAFSCWLGASLSGVFESIPSGAMIVLSASMAFLLSMLFGTRRGVVVRWGRRIGFHRKIDSNHLLRGLYETLEARDRTASDSHGVEFDTLLGLRSWSRSRLSRILKAEMRRGNVQRIDDRRYGLSTTGLELAGKYVREHRLWEMYLIAHADVAPSRVDHDADAIEHVLEPEMIAELEKLLSDQDGIRRLVPPDPHAARPHPPAPHLPQ